MDEDRALGQQAAHFRKKAKLTQEELAAMIDCDPTHVSRFEAGKRAMSVARLRRLAAAVRTTMSGLFADEKSIAEDRGLLLTPLLAKLVKLARLLDDDDLRALISMAQRMLRR